MSSKPKNYLKTLQLVNRQILYENYYYRANPIKLTYCSKITPLYIMNIRQENVYKSLLIDSQLKAWLLLESTDIVVKYYFHQIGCNYNCLCDFISMNSKFNIDDIPFVYGQSIFLKIFRDQSFFDWVNISEATQIIIKDNKFINFCFNNHYAEFQIIFDNESDFKKCHLQLQLAKQMSDKFGQSLIQIFRNSHMLHLLNQTHVQFSVFNKLKIQEGNHLTLTVDDFNDFRILNSASNYLFRNHDAQTKRISKYLVKYHFDIESILVARNLYLKRTYS